MKLPRKKTLTLTLTLNVCVCFVCVLWVCVLCVMPLLLRVCVVDLFVCVVCYSFCGLMWGSSLVVVLWFDVGFFLLVVVLSVRTRMSADRSRTWVQPRTEPKQACRSRWALLQLLHKPPREPPSNQNQSTVVVQYAHPQVSVGGCSLVVSV